MFTFPPKAGREVCRIPLRRDPKDALSDALDQPNRSHAPVLISHTVPTARRNSYTFLLLLISANLPLATRHYRTIIMISPISWRPPRSIPCSSWFLSRAREKKEIAQEAVAPADGRAAHGEWSASFARTRSRSRSHSSTASNQRMPSSALTR